MAEGKTYKLGVKAPLNCGWDCFLDKQIPSTGQSRKTLVFFTQEFINYQFEL